MTVTEVRSPERPTAGDAALVASLKRPRYEIFPLDGVEDEVARHIPAEVKLTITASPSKGMEPTLKLAERLRRRGYDVVPHLSARLVRDREHLEQVIERLEAADVREVFVIAGDPREAAGEFAGAAGLLSAMDISRHLATRRAITSSATRRRSKRCSPWRLIVSDLLRHGRDRIWSAGCATGERSFRSVAPGPGRSDDRGRAFGLGSRPASSEPTAAGWPACCARAPTRPPSCCCDWRTIADPAARIGGLHVYTFNELSARRTGAGALAQLTRDNDE